MKKSQRIPQNFMKPAKHRFKPDPEKLKNIEVLQSLSNISEANCSMLEETPEKQPNARYEAFLDTMTTNAGCLQPFTDFQSELHLEEEFHEQVEQASQK